MTALAGRQRELGVLRDVLARVRAERTPQLVTVVGVPGIGKSRLVFELSRIADGGGADQLAAGPLASLWREAQLLGARGDGEGAGGDPGG
jgi:ATP-dependent Clp protease ATP-binding subunit ClpA